VKAGLRTAPPVSIRFSRWGRMYGPRGTLLRRVEDWWSSSFRVALKSPPTMLAMGGRSGKLFQKVLCTWLSAGA